MASDSELNSWEKEEIPPEHRLFMRVEKTYVKNGSLTPGVFKNRPTESDGMSTDWERYSTPTDTKNRARVPENNGVIQLVVGQVREIPNQIVEHTPSIATTNRAHTDVFGPKDTEVRLKLKRVAEWVQGFECLNAQS